MTRASRGILPLSNSIILAGPRTHRRQTQILGASGERRRGQSQAGVRLRRQLMEAIVARLVFLDDQLELGGHTAEVDGSGLLRELRPASGRDVLGRGRRRPWARCPRGAGRRERPASALVESGGGSCPGRSAQRCRVSWFPATPGRRVGASTCARRNSGLTFRAPFEYSLSPGSSSRSPPLTLNSHR